MAEDDEAKRLMEQWGLDNDDDDDDDKAAGGDGEAGAAADDDEMEDADDYHAKFRREVTAGDNELDHIILGTSDLDRALADLQNMIGTKPVISVSLKGVGTKSARLAFESCQFFEIMGPDPNAKAMPLHQKLASLPEGKLVPLHYAIRSSNIVNTKKWSQLGLVDDSVTMVGQDQGEAWTWTTHILEGHEFGGLVPFIIEWKDPRHAAGRLPVVGALKEVKVSAPANCPVHELLDGINGIWVQVGEPLLEFSFTNEKGYHSFSTTEPLGIEFPK